MLEAKGVISAQGLTANARIHTHRPCGIPTLAGFDNHRCALDTWCDLAQLSPTEPSGNGIAPVTAPAASPWDATESQTLSRRVSKGFRDASQNKKTKDANEFPQALAEAHIEVMSRVKVIGAVAKGVDKISNLG